jgi:hypothetical protein
MGERDVKKGAEKYFEKNLLGGKESDPKLAFYKKKVTEEWKKGRVRALIDEAKQLTWEK